MRPHSCPSVSHTVPLPAPTARSLALPLPPGTDLAQALTAKESIARKKAAMSPDVAKVGQSKRSSGQARRRAQFPTRRLHLVLPAPAYLPPLTGTSRHIGFMRQALDAASSPAVRTTGVHGAFHSAPANGTAWPPPSAGSCPPLLWAVRGDGAAQQRTQCHGCQLGVAGGDLVQQALWREGAASASIRRARLRQPAFVSVTTQLCRIGLDRWPMLAVRRHRLSPSGPRLTLSRPRPPSSPWASPSPWPRTVPSSR